MREQTCITEMHLLSIVDASGHHAYVCVCVCVSEKNVIHPWRRRRDPTKTELAAEWLTSVAAVVFLMRNANVFPARRCQLMSDIS